jgi:DNA-binding GntR family transcriptional regulator
MSAKSQQALSTGPTLADQAYRALRDEIISGRLKPGERLTERHLATRLGVSPTPIREALQRLEHEHLIQRTDTRRILVAEPRCAESARASPPRTRPTTSSPRSSRRTLRLATR